MVPAPPREVLQPEEAVASGAGGGGAGKEELAEQGWGQGGGQGQEGGQAEAAVVQGEGGEVSPVEVAEPQAVAAAVADQPQPVAEAM